MQIKKIEKNIENKPDNSKIDRKLTIFDYAEKYLSEKYDIRKNIVSNDFEIKLKKEKNYNQLNENNLYIELQKNGIAITENKLIAILKRILD